MDQKKEFVFKQDDKLVEGSVSRAQSQDALDSSSASSLSIFADHNDGQNSSLHENGKSSDCQISEECCSPGAPIDEALKSEKAFIEFVMSLPPKEISEQHHRSTDSVIPRTKSSTPAGNTTKVGLDHLDNLCKLMEQLSELRDTNNKLQKRVLYLEDLKTLHDMHKEISDETQYSSEDALTTSTRPHPYELKKSATESSCCPKSEDLPVMTRTRGHSSKYQGRRGRAQSADGQKRERSKSVGHEDAGEDTKTKRIFPKWSKVKEALGWESDRKDSVKLKVDEESGILPSPRRSSDDSHLSYHLPKSPTWSHDYPSLHSSLEDVHEILDSDLKTKSSTIERDSYNHPDYSKFDKDDAKRGKSPWGRVKTIIERRRDSLKRRSIRREHGCGECETIQSKKMPEVAEIKSYAEYVESTARQPIISDTHKHKNYVPAPIVIDEEVDYGGLRTPSSSPTLHRKSRWTRVKKALKGKKEDDRDISLSTPASPNSGQEGHFPFDVNEEITHDSCDDGRELKRVGSDSHVHQLSLSAPNCDLMLQLQRNLSEDFNRKIMEWERIRSAGNASCSPHWDRKPSVMIRSRKKSERDDKSAKPKLKDLTWLEKELQKVEKEKQRLSKERQKYEERALRLEKLKETVLNAKNSNKREVLVRTSAGEFRFEGISDAFTKKLYEWETKRGLGPELSTIALLDASRLTVQTNISPKSGTLQRIISRSESSIADIGQPSHNSSNSLPSLKIPDSRDSDRVNQPSRANSVPDLSTLVALTNGSKSSITNLTMQVGDSLEDEIVTTPGVSRESEEDEKKRNDSETYYGLLEENVILLEQLKDKEDICSRLETELQMLDNKVDVMDKHHRQETERYREKLWEMHKPGATPRDVQCCLRTMSQLRKRIEVLEKFTEKLKNDRESVEDSFRYHSKQQEDMTLDLLQKMSELQAAGSSTAECEGQEYIPSSMNMNAVEKLQDLSALLVKQTQELQETLSSKTRQICQLRWELLHRDLSSVKLETELHTHSAHRKRSKYAHFRSHSSEEAATLPMPQELECGKSALITEAYYNANSESDFRATELSYTVQQLNREVLKLANATEFPQGDLNHSEDYQAMINNEISKTKMSPPSKTMKQITVRRSSAENISAAFGKDGNWKQKHVSSSDSDDSSDDGYTKISFRPLVRNNFVQNPSVERLLMSSEEHPPRGYLHRRKKLQKTSKSNLSPSRRRSNTFHNKRDFEKPFVFEHTPQKCHSFRLPTERNSDHPGVRNTSKAVNIRNILDEDRYQEYLKKRTQMGRSSNGQASIPLRTSQMATDSRADGQWLREVSSDSKIPLLFQLQYRKDDVSQDMRASKFPVRSLSDKHGKEVARERRENFQRKNNKKHLTSPDLFCNLSEALKARILAATSSQQKATKNTELKDNSNCVIKNSPPKSEYSDNKVLTTNIPLSNTENSSVTVRLPKKKSRKMHVKIPQDNEEQTFTIVFPKKRSLSSEKENDSFQDNNSSMELLSEKSTEKSNSDRYKTSSPAHFHTESNLYGEDQTPSDQNAKFKTHEMHDSQTSQTANDGVLNEPTSRKRKAEDVDSSLNDISKSESVHITNPQTNYNTSKYTSSDSLTKNEGKEPNKYGPSYVKSSSASYLDWRKVCAKKISREGAPNVKSLIEKYNKVAQGETTRSANSSSLSSPICIRKISAPVYNSKSDRNIPSHSFSTPTTPCVISASEFYNPLVFRPINLDVFPRSAPESPLSATRAEAIKKAKEQFITSQNTSSSLSQIQKDFDNKPILTLRRSNEKTTKPESRESISSSIPIKTDTESSRRRDDDRISNSSMDSMSLVMFRTGETCQESRLAKRSVDYSRQDSDTLERKNNLKTSKSLSNSSIFKSVLNSEFKIPSNLLKLKRSKRKKEMVTVSQLCRQSLLLTTEDTGNVPNPPSHKSCPSSPVLQNKSEVKLGWFHKNIFRHK